MTKFNFDLSANPFSTKQPLDKDEIFLLSSYFTAIAKNHKLIPDDVLSDMADIQKQFESNHRLSEKQVNYVTGIAKEYCEEFREWDDTEDDEDDWRD